MIRPRTPRALLVLAPALLTFAACDGGGYEVEARFEPEGLSADAVAVEFALVPSCAGQPLGDPAVGALARASLRRMGSSEPLGNVAPGDYGLYARAAGSDCVVVGAGCESVTLEAGGQGLLSVTLRPLLGPGCPAGTACDEGLCLGPDGGVDECPGGCDDGDACTTDRCVGGACVSSTRDADSDGHGDEACPVVGGVPNDDCDDGSPDAYTGAAELCNGADDDCDGSSDEDFECVEGRTEACPFCGPGARACDATCSWGACGPAGEPGVVALYSFDDEPSTDAFSDALAGRDGALVDGTASWTAGPLGCGEAMLLSGGGEYGEVANDAAWDLPAGALDAWVRFDASGVVTGVIGRDASGTTLPGHLTIGRTALDVLEARIQNLAGEVTRCTTAAVPTGPWLEVSVRFGPPDFELVVDGVRAAGCEVGANAQGIDGNENPWVFGAHTYTSEEGLATPILDPLAGALDHVQIRSTRASAEAPEITSFVLVDADADVSLGPIADGSVLELGSLPAINVRVGTDPAEVGMVVFDLDGTSGFATEGAAPYALASDTAGDYDVWAAEPGTHTISATAFSAAGNPGATRTITITVR